MLSIHALILIINNTLTLTNNKLIIKKLNNFHHTAV